MTSAWRHIDVIMWSHRRCLRSYVIHRHVSLTCYSPSRQHSCRREQSERCCALRLFAVRMTMIIRKPARLFWSGVFLPTCLRLRGWCAALRWCPGEDSRQSLQHCPGRNRIKLNVIGFAVFCKLVSYFMIASLVIWNCSGGLNDYLCRWKYRQLQLVEQRGAANSGVVCETAVDQPFTCTQKFMHCPIICKIQTLGLKRFCSWKVFVIYKLRVRTSTFI